MDTIRHLRTMYWPIGGDHAAIATAVARLDRIQRDGLVEAYDAAVHAAMPEQSEVVVIRKVHGATSLWADALSDDRVVAEALARQMAVAVARTVRDDPGDGANLVRFASEQEFVVQFVSAVLDGDAWTHWYFFPFAAVQQLPPAQAIRSVLLDHRDSLPAILAALGRSEYLERWFRRAGPDDLDVIWSEELHPIASLDPESLRPLLGAAVSVVDRLSWWRHRRPGSGELETLFQRYLDLSPQPPDWNDRRGLAIVVVEIIRFIASCGWLNPDGARSELRADSDLDWLDLDYLAAHVTTAFGFQSAPVRSPRELTPRHAQLVADLIGVITSRGVRLDGTLPDGAANHLRLFAALMDRFPHWAANDFARIAVADILAGWGWLRRAAGSMRLVEGLTLEQIDRSLQEGASDHGSEAIRRLMATLGGQVVAGMLGALNASAGSVDQTRATPTSVEDRPGKLATRCAGVFLVARAILDANLAAIVAALADTNTGPRDPRRDPRDPRQNPHDLRDPWPDSNDQRPDFSNLLAAIALRWTGDAGLESDGPEVYLDEGLSLFCGFQQSPKIEELRQPWRSLVTHAALQESLFARLVGLRAIGGSTLHLHEIATETGDRALVAGVEATDVWPLAGMLDAAGPVPLIQRWVVVWTAVAGNPPRVVVSAPDLHDALQGSDLQTVLVDPISFPEPSGDLHSELHRQHVTSAEGLNRALAAIDQGRLAVPEADLTIALLSLALLRVWARWLGRFADSSAPYLLDRFIRRSGYVEVDREGLVVSFESRPLDIVLDLAGYTDPIARIPWLDDRGVRFERTPAS
jgi:hypothetical protein